MRRIAALAFPIWTSLAGCAGPSEIDRTPGAVPAAVPLQPDAGTAPPPIPIEVSGTPPGPLAFTEGGAEPRPDLARALADLDYPGGSGDRWSVRAFSRHVVVLHGSAEGRVPDELVAIESTSARTAWRRQAANGGFLIVGAADVDGGTPILLVRDGITAWVEEAREFRPLLRAIDLLDGRERWTSTALPGNDVWLLGATPEAVIAAGRCECGAERRPVCATRVAALDRESGAVRWDLGREPTCDLPAFLWSLAGGRLLLATAGTLSAVDAGSGAVAWNRPSLGKVRSVFAQERQVAVATAVALEVLDAGSGSLVWSRAGDFLEVGPAAAPPIGPPGGSWTATRAIDSRGAERVILDAGGAPLCRSRFVLPGPTPRELPGGACHPLRAAIRGRLVVDGRPRAGVRIEAGGVEVRTGRDGGFSIEVDAPGDYLVGPVAGDLGRRPPRTCVWGEDGIAHVAAAGEAAEVVLEFEERAPLCASGGCAPIDCE